MKSSLTESLQITITLTRGALLGFFQSGVEKLLAWLGIESATLDLSSHQVPYTTHSG